MIFLLILFVILLAIFLQFHFRPLKDLPGPKPWPLVGNLIELLWRKGPIHEAMVFQLKDIGRRFHNEGFAVIWTGPVPVVTLFRADHVAAVLKSKVLIDKPFEYSFSKKWLGNGLTIANGATWRWMRKLLNPTFKSNKLTYKFLPTVNEHARVLVDVLSEKEKHKDFVKLAMNCTFDIIIETMMGIKSDAQIRGFSEYADALHGFSAVLMDRLANPLHRFDWIYNLTSASKKSDRYVSVMQEFTKNAIGDRRAAIKKNNLLEDFEDSSLADILIRSHANGEITEKDIEEQVQNFIAAGYDAGAISLSFIIFLLGNNMQIQGRLRDELLEIMDSEEVTADHVNRMPYLDMVVREGMRKYPAAPLYMRHLAEDLKLGAFVVPKGNVIALDILALHHDEDVYPDAERFIPERFSKENLEGRSDHTWLPFSSGPRGCIGKIFALLELKILVAYLVKNFRIESLCKEKDLKLEVGIDIKPKGDLGIKFTRLLY